MGSLKPGITYIYEREGDILYSREVGSNERTIISYDYKHDTRTDDRRSLRDHLLDNKLWHDIRKEAQSNPALQLALDRAIIIYRLGKDKPL